jgi:hypothetical protein
MHNAQSSMVNGQWLMVNAHFSALLVEIIGKSLGRLPENEYLCGAKPKLD